MADLDLVRILRNRPSDDGMVDMTAPERDWLCDEVDRSRAENAELADRLALITRAADVMAAENESAAHRITGGPGEAEGGVPADATRLRAENSAMAAALADIAGMRMVTPLADGEVWMAEAECGDLVRGPCHMDKPTDPGGWCPVCVAEVAWCAWKMGVLR